MSIKGDLDLLDPTTKLLTILEREIMYDSESAAKRLITDKEATQMIISIVVEEDSFVNSLSNNMTSNERPIRTQL